MGPDHLCLEETIHLLESQRQAKTLTACLDFSKEWFSQAQIKIRSGLATIHLLSFHRTSLLSFQKKKKTMLRWKKVLNRNGQAPGRIGNLMGDLEKNNVGPEGKQVKLSQRYSLGTLKS